MSNPELLHAVRLLECRDGEPRALEYDHRQYLQRHELERLVRLAVRLRRRPRANQVAGQGQAGPQAAAPLPR